MIKGAFEYYAPGSIDEAAELVASLDGDTSVISGGTWVVPEMTHGIRTPRHVVDLRRAGVGGIERENGSLVVEVRDDGIGGADPGRGSGLRGLADRVAVVDGRLIVTSNPGAGTIVHAEIPCAFFGATGMPTPPPLLPFRPTMDEIV